MSQVRWNTSSGEVALTAATAKTVLQIVAASNHRTVISGLSIMGKGIVVTDTPMKVRVLRQSTAGTMTAATVVKANDGDDETLQTTAQHTATAEPTAGDVLYQWEVHPQSGIMIFLPFKQEIAIKGGGRLGVEVTAVQAQTVAVNAEGEE